MQIWLKSTCFQQLCPAFEAYQRLNSTVSFLQNEQHLVCIRGALYPDYVRRQRLNTAENAFQTPEFNRSRICFCSFLFSPYLGNHKIARTCWFDQGIWFTFRAHVRKYVSRDMCLQILCIQVLCISTQKPINSLYAYVSLLSVHEYSVVRAKLPPP